MPNKADRRYLIDKTLDLRYVDAGYLQLDWDPRPYMPGVNWRDVIIAEVNADAMEKLLPEGGHEGEKKFNEKYPDIEYPGDVVYEKGALLVSPDAPAAIKALNDVEGRLENYPVLDEDEYSKREYQHVSESADSEVLGVLDRLGYNGAVEDVLDKRGEAYLGKLEKENPEKYRKLMDELSGMIAAEESSDTYKLALAALIRYYLDENELTDARDIPEADLGKFGEFAFERAAKIIDGCKKEETAGTREYQDIAEEAGQLRLFESRELPLPLGKGFL
jgi:hypothetical protein